MQWNCDSSLYTLHTKPVQSTNLMIKKDFQEEKRENKCLPRKRIVSRDDLISLVPIKKGQENSEIMVWNRIIRQGIRYRCLHTISRYNIQLILYSLLLPHFPLRFSGENFDSHIKINNWSRFLFVVPVMRCQGERIREWSVLPSPDRWPWPVAVSSVHPHSSGERKTFESWSAD